MNTIPDMINPLGKAWDQPSRDNILLDDKNALMAEQDLFKLKEYSSSYPSGVYDGKMWKRINGGVTWLCWYAPSEKPDACSIQYREVITV